MINYPEKAVYTYDDLVDILRILRAPGGCPWDREQTHESNRRNFLEEAYEAAEAFDLDDPELMKEELGDVLMQVLFNIHMEEEAGRFTTDDVTDHVVRKLIFRHPHVFSNTRADDSEQVLVNWDKLKRQEKGQRTTADAMDSVARSLPALWRADKLQSKAAKAGFEFPDVSGALDKLDEETQELRSAVENGTNFEEELGDVLFAAVKVGRFCGVDPEAALSKTCCGTTPRNNSDDQKRQRFLLIYTPEAPSPDTIQEDQTMNKTELIAAVAEKASISKKESEVVINAALDTIIDSLKNDEKVQLVGFGSFETKHRAERTGRNPKTKESITIAASKVPTFKAGKAFKDAVAE